MTIQEILEAHTVKRPWSEATRMKCKCGEVVTAETEAHLYALHRRHVSEVLEAQMQERCYEAWREGVAVFDPDAVDIMEAANPYPPTKDITNGR